MKYTITKITPVTKFHNPYYLTKLILLTVWKKKINLDYCREMHTSTCTHTGWGVVLMTGFPPLLCQEEHDVGNFFLTLGFHLGLFSCLLTRQWTLLFFFSTGLQVPLICLYNIKWILYVLDNAFCFLLLLTLVLSSSKLWVSLIYLCWVFAFLVWFQAPSYQSRPVFV